MYVSIFGTCHPEVANSQKNVALFYQSIGKEKKAEEYFRKSLDIYRERDEQEKCREIEEYLKRIGEK